MSKGDKEQLRRLLEEIADHLDGASTKAETQALSEMAVQGRPDRERFAYQAGALEAITRGSATSLRAVITTYLEPKRRAA